MKSNFTKTLIKLYYKLIARISGKRRRRIVLKMTAGNYKLLLKMADQVNSRLTGNPSFRLPPETLTSLSKAAKELERSIKQLEEAKRRAA